MSAITEYLRRAAAPRIVVATSRMRWSQRCGAALRRALKMQRSIDLFFAFDDPYAAIAFPGLINIAVSNKTALNLLPLIQRGIDGDPAAAQRSAHAITDSRRLAMRDGRTLIRNAPLSAKDCAFLALWTSAAAQHPKAQDFVAAALKQLWFANNDVPTPEAYAALYLAHIGTPPPDISTDLQAMLTGNALRLKQLGHWESPAVRVAGEWYLAHERLEQINAHLRALGA